MKRLLDFWVVTCIVLIVCSPFIVVFGFRFAWLAAGALMGSP